MKPHKQLAAALLLTLVTAASAAATPEQPDTLFNITDAGKLLITESPEGVSVKVIKPEAEGDTVTEILTRSFDEPTTVNLRRWTTPLSASKGHGMSRWEFCIGGPGIGWTSAQGQPDGLGVEMSKSLEISWLNALSLRYSMPWKWSTLSIGLGFDWRNYRISTSGVRFTPDGYGRTGYGPYPEGVTPHGSRLKVFSIGIPVLWTQGVPVKWLDGAPFDFSVGAVFNYNSHASLLTKWTEPDGRKAEQKSNHIGHRRFSIDLIALLKIGWGLNAYVRYSPQTVLRGAGQPKFRPLSAGLIFLY